jgi:hypothetical protein
MARLLVIVASVLCITACDAAPELFVPDVSCAGWRNLGNEERASISEQMIRADRLFRGVQVAQHVPPDTPEEQLVAMAVESITKNCELQRWSPELRVRRLLQDLYA